MKRNWFAFSITLALFLASYFWIVHSRAYVPDEVCHYSESIRRLLDGNWQHADCLTTIRGYHIIMAKVLGAIGFTDLTSARALNTIWAFAFGLICFAWYGRQEAVGQPILRWIRTFQIMTFPIFAPYFSLVYTDTLSAAAGLTAFILAESGFAFYAAIACVLAISARQTQVIWPAFFSSLMILRQGAFSWRHEIKEEAALGDIEFKVRLAALVRGFEKSLAYIYALAVFFAWYLWNGSLAAGAHQLHPDFALSLGNIWFFFGLLPILFLPYLLSEGRSHFDFVRSNAKLCVIVSAFLLGLFLISFHPNHPYNQTGHEFFNWFLRNRMLQWAAENLFSRLVAFGFVITGLLMAVRWSFTKSEYRLFIPIFCVLLSFHWLIEQRYCLPLILFMMLTRRSSGVRTEVAQLFYQVALTAAVYWGLASNSFFL